MDSISKRRIAEDQRKLRIFNPKIRRIGVDIEGLNSQIQENIRAKIKEIEWEREYAETMKRNNSLALLLEQKRSDEFKEHCQEIDRFCQTFQKPENRRDFDLYDPNLKKKEFPPRMSDSDNCPISGIQRLEGEDLQYSDRLKKQREQMQDILLQQMQEKRIINFRNNEAEWARNAAILQQNNEGFRRALQEQSDTKKAAISLQNENIFLAWQQQGNKMNWKKEEEKRDRSDIDFNLHGDLLTENMTVARSGAGPHRVLPDRWKGMNKDELKNYYDGQVYQMALNQRRKEREQEEKALWDYHILRQQNTSWLRDELERKHTLKLNKDLEVQNIALANQQRQQYDFFNKVTNVNIPSEDFFNQFNTNSR